MNNNNHPSPPGQWRFLQPERQRDVLFVLGAGASIADGAPLKEQILPSILFNGDQDILNSELGREVIDFISTNFAVSREYCPSLEAVFGYLEYFIKRRESLGGSFTTERIINIKNGLIQLIHHVIGTKRRSSKQTYAAFWDWLARTSRNVAIITMNYDTLLEDAFDPLFPQTAMIDYCLRFMNYDHLNALEHFHQWVNPREPVWVEEGADPRPIKIMKLHGSLNWKYCNCCNQVLLTPGETGINLSSRGFVRHVGRCGKSLVSLYEDFRCPLDQTRFNTLIIPPSYIKELEHPIINILLDEASREIRSTRRIIFVGYSFADADVHIKALFRKNIAPNTEIWVVNPDLKPEQKSGYDALAENVCYLPMSFETFLDDHNLRQDLLAYQSPSS